MGDEALFLPDGDGFMPTELSRGPWTPDALHGGPPAALLARAIEAHDGEGAERGDQFLARLSVELVRPVPVERVSITTATSRPGRRVQLVSAVMTSGGVEVARAVGLRTRIKELELPPGVEDEPPPSRPASVEEGIDDERWGYRAFHNEAVDTAFVSGRFREPGPATVWFRLRVPVVAGEKPSGPMRAAATADFGNGISGVLPFDQWLFINPDLTVTLSRPPEGEWICLDATTHVTAVGAGFAESALYDERSRVGRSVQSLLVDDTR